jgi:hypothetical protein
MAKVDGRFVHWVRRFGGGDRFSLIFYMTAGEGSMKRRAAYTDFKPFAAAEADAEAAKYDVTEATVVVAEKAEMAEMAEMAEKAAAITIFHFGTAENKEGGIPNTDPAAPSTAAVPNGTFSLRVIEGDPSVLPGDDTGGILWSSAEVLARYLAAPGVLSALLPNGPDYSSEKNPPKHTAVELGCGCALASLVLGAHGKR